MNDRFHDSINTNSRRTFLKQSGLIFAGTLAGSALPALLWGVAFTNIVRGVPIDAEMEYVGGFWNLLNPVALLGGLVTLTLFLTHGALFVALKTDGQLRHDARVLGMRLGVIAAALAVVWLWIMHATTGNTVSWTLAGLAAIVLLLGLAAATGGQPPPPQTVCPGAPSATSARRSPTSGVPDRREPAGE